MTVMSILIAVGTLGLGLGLGFLIRKKIAEAKIQSAESQANQILADAKKRMETLKKEAELEVRDQRLQAKTSLEDEVRSRKQEIFNLERRVRLP